MLPVGQINSTLLARNLSSLSRKNTPLSPSGKSTLRLRASHPNEGRLAIVTDVAVRCGGREGARKTSARDADGEVVWSWRPGAGAKFRGINPDEVTVARKPVTGESTK